MHPPGVPFDMGPVGLGPIPLLVLNHLEESEIAILNNLGLNDQVVDCQITPFHTFRARKITFITFSFSLLEEAPEMLGLADVPGELVRVAPGAVAGSQDALVHPGEVGAAGADELLDEVETH